MTTYAIDTHTGDGSQTDFTLSYNYFEVDDLIVKVDNVTKTSGTDYDIVDGSTVRFTSAPANGTTVTVERDTDINNKKVTFSDGGTIRASDMNNQNDQLLFAVQEASDDSQNALRTNGTFYDAGNDRIANVGTPTASTDATTKAYVDQIETDATQQATNAAASATAAASSATAAASSASAASTSETNASSSASTASTHATNAASSETAAASSATSAASSATAAQTAQTAAETAETNAETAETNAETAKTAAQAAQTAAETAETNAETAETNAATSATNAATSETNAGTSETNAASSANAAAASATSASNAQTAAESARDSALASFDSFDDRYLGAKTSDPTVDNDGNALVAGALYFNSTDGEMKVYNGTSWVDAYADGTTLVSKSGDTMTGDLSFGDDDKAIFGAGSDLQIFHNSGNGNSIIKEQGGGILSLQTNGNEIALYDTANGANMSRFITGGAVQLYHNGSTKLSTSAGGANVTGGVNVATDGTGLAIDSSSNAYMVIDRGAANRRGELVFSTASASVLNAPPLSATADWALGVSDSDELAGDAFYIGTASGAGNAKMVITQSGNVGIGTNSPEYVLDVDDASGNAYIAINRASQSQGEVGFKLGGGTSGDDWYIYQPTSTNNLSFYKGGDKVTITDAGKVGIGVTPSYNFQTSVGSGSISSGNHFKFATGSDSYGGGIQSKHYFGVVFIGRTASDGQGIRFNTNEVGPATGNLGNGFSNDNVQDLGGSSNRWDDVRATNGTIQTSDQTLKQDISSLTDAEITAAKAISRLFKTFKWIDKVEAKGDDARTHTGVIAQEVEQAMTDAGLDATKYAFWCSDTWWEAEVTYEDENGDEHTGIADFKTIEEAPEGATEVTRLSIRYPELLAFIGAATEQRLADIETRLTALEA